jgi:hypothetical protein
MRDQLVDNVCVALDRKVEAPGPVHACLPDVGCFIVLLRVERGVVKIKNQERDLLSNAFCTDTGAPT